MSVARGPPDDIVDAWKVALHSECFRVFFRGQPFEILVSNQSWEETHVDDTPLLIFLL